MSSTKEPRPIGERGQSPADSESTPIDRVGSVRLGSAGAETNDRPESARTDEEAIAEIEAVSVEGRPANPRVGPRRIGLLLLSMCVVVLAAAVLAAVAVSPSVGVMLAVFSFVLLLVNPEVWASVSRARERREAQRRHQHGDTEPAARWPRPTVVDDAPRPEARP